MTESDRLKLDLITGYLLTATRVGVWALIFVILFRHDRDDANVYTYCRGIAAFIPVLMLNLASALYWRLSIPDAAVADQTTAEPLTRHQIDTIPYATPIRKSPGSTTPAHQILFVCGSAALLLAVGNMAVLFTLPWGDLLQPPQYHTDPFVNTFLALSIAAILRVVSDVPAVILQKSNRLWLDNVAVISCELFPVVIALQAKDPFFVALSAAVSMLVLWLVRSYLAGMRWRVSVTSEFRYAAAERTNLLTYGFKVSLSQVADLLYAPLTLILIGKMTTFIERDLTIYSTLLQFDAALLLLTAAITTTLIPRVSNLLSANDPRTALRYTFKANAISLAILTAAAVTLYFTAGPILNLWLGSTPTGLLSVLPIFLIHTVIGGASAPLRAVLLLAGKAKQLTIANTLGGLAVATATFLILKYPTHTATITGLLPLQAIAAATALSVTLRCALWMPWYTRRVLKYK